MADQKLHAILGVSPRKSLIEQPEPDEDLEYQAFSFGRVGTRPVPMICFIKADGYYLALPYVELRSVSSSDPGNGFEIVFSSHQLIVEGRNLIVPFRYLRENRLAEIFEASQTKAFQIPSNEGVISRLVISGFE